MRTADTDWNWTDASRLVWRRRFVVVAGVALAGGLAAAVAFALPRTYQAAVTLRLGRVVDRYVQDPEQLTALVQTNGFATLVRRRGFEDMEVDLLLNNFQAVSGSAGSPASRPMPFVTLQVRAEGRDRALGLARAAAEAILEDHWRRYEQMLKLHTEYRDSLSLQVGAIRGELQEIETLLKRFRNQPTVDAPAILLMRAQQEEKEALLLTFTRELLTVQVGISSLTEETAIAGDIVTPGSQMRPRRTLIALAGGAAGGLFAVFWILAAPQGKADSKLASRV